MDAATIQARIYAGYAKVALRIGFSADQYRPATALNPTAIGNKLRSIPASFNAEDMTYSKPNKYGKATWFGLFDGRLTAPGDYLKNTQDGTFFIAAQQTNLPILLVSCNAVVDIHRPQQQSGVGTLSYGGNTAATESALMAQWPCSILQSGKGDKDLLLPGDVKSPQWSILLPYFAGVTLRTADIILDNLARRYIVNSAELTDLGWRITAAQAQT